eukprot:4576628-Pyramimonas_sp.AAC.1
MLFALASSMPAAGSAAPWGAHQGAPTSARHRGSGLTVMVGVAAPIRTQHHTTSSWRKTTTSKLQPKRYLNL